MLNTIKSFLYGSTYSATLDHLQRRESRRLRSISTVSRRILSRSLEALRDRRVHCFSELVGDRSVVKRSYADALLDIIDPNHTIKFVWSDWMSRRHRLYREHCLCIDENYLKDLNSLDRELVMLLIGAPHLKKKTVIIDNTPYAFGYQIDNGIPITSWFDDKEDTALKDLIPFLRDLVKVEDVRPVLRQKYKLKEKLDGFVYGWRVCYKQSSWSRLNHTWGFDLAGEDMLQYIFRKDLHDILSTPLEEKRAHRYLYDVDKILLRSERTDPLGIIGTATEDLTNT